jgi:proteic killer suppression protein
MIRSFKCKDTEAIFNLDRSKKFPADLQQVILRKLKMLNRSIDIRDLRIPPANRLEMLKGSRTGQWSIRVNNQWRICFTWDAGDAYSVEVVDYHR